jgi:cytochrome c553
MGPLFRNAEHLLRLVVVLVVAVIAFFVLRQAMVPPSYGQYGPYRPGALEDNRNHPIKYAGHESCELCHDAVVAVKKTGRHARIACETCHGALVKHTEDAIATKPRRPEVAGLCVRCHEADAAKPKTFPQVISKEHSGGVPCNSCHQPHRPKP